MVGPERAPSGRPEQARDGDIFVDLRPVNTVPASDESPLSPLLDRCLRQARKPCQRRRQFPSVGESDD
jgi:hypothetical protein